MISFFDDFFKPIICFIIILFICIAVLVTILFYFDSKACDDYRRISGLKNEWTIYNGCMVEYEGVWINRNKVNIYKLKEK